MITLLTVVFKSWRRLQNVSPHPRRLPLVEDAKAFLVVFGGSL